MVNFNPPAALYPGKNPGVHLICLGELQSDPGKEKNPLPLSVFE
jgi:hypothetical protein